MENTRCGRTWCVIWTVCRAGGLAAASWLAAATRAFACVTKDLVETLALSLARFHASLAAIGALRLVTTENAQKRHATKG